MTTETILMADIIKSRNKKAGSTVNQLHTLVAVVNKKFKKDILSPLTITLGDEFQAIIKNIYSGIEIIFYIEEYCIENSLPFKLRYVILEGMVETPINRKIAYGMLGKGLTKARETINMLKKKEERFWVLPENKESVLNNLFILYQSIVDDWKPRDYKIVTDFIRLDDYKLVAEENEKTASQMWKRKRSLKIREYNVVKTLISQKNGLV